ncbi:prolyl oligopeptidase family serine peptidase [Actinobacillus pleuropneumoniae]|uniref:prolyl oligopeptidase family serine peptidase n=1 Tax=Actinobacillus pleuropneumoniae TaxID=715 RepID=UPI00071CF945|nr:prolyl oligopeptidase family serine peptidase [Actinobacillus pleuropneumoniae]QXP23616.1 prolyl oligopeptidase family serine peptidase [Actinobacillus pleuropneumoniae serovar 8 str. 405]UKH37619.1 hypothetical protein D1101_08635 [Actinobacillus pleuropneumoniae serovar 8 str. 405]CUU53000.1 hypothetical protein MIDG2331_01763 [Actinobacillus pleuropneumoniae serovar 8]
MQLTHKSKIQVEIINGYKISYILKPSRKDIAHLVVLFNGYRHYGWDFDKSINFFKCNSLMIVDIFKDEQSCYLGSSGELHFSDVVACLIERVLNRLYLTKDDCTLLGASKGGFAALFIGIKYDFPNIVSSAPVAHIGSWMKNYNQNIATHVMGNNYNEDNIAYYNNLLFTEIENSKNLNKSIYFFLSRNDHFYHEYGQKELLDKLESKYKNLNVFYTESELAFQHNQVTSYFLQEILSVTNLLSQKVYPTLNKHFIDDTSYNSIVLPNIRSKAILSHRKHSILLKEESINKISMIKIIDGKLFVEGLLYIKNYNSETYKDLNKYISFNSIINNTMTEYLLGTVPKIEQTRELYEDYLFNYSAAGTATLNFKGIDLSSLENGTYKLNISVTKSNTDRDYKSLVLDKQINHKYIYKDCEYYLVSRKNDTFLTKRNILGDKNISSLFTLNSYWVRESRFHIEGEYIIKGLAMPDFHIGNYYLVAKNLTSNETYSYLLGQVKKNDLSKKLNDIYGNYVSCYYATMKFEGIDTQIWENGEYELYVSLSHNNEIFSEKLNKKLLVNDKQCEF